MISKATNKILIIRLSSFGDILLTTPIIRALKKTYPFVGIDYLVADQYADLIRYNPYISNIYEYDKSGSNKKLLNELKQNSYNLIIDLHNNLRSRIVSMKLQVNTVRYKKPSIKKYLLVNFKWNLLEDAKTIPERYAEVLPDLELDERGLEFFFPKSDEITRDENLIGFCPGSKHFTKMWPAEYFAELGNLLSRAGFKIVLLGGRDDQRICSKLETQIKGVVNKCSENNLLLTATEMKRCKLVICNDSGLMHLAAALNVPIAALFGSTVKEFGFFPYKSKSLVLENNSISCRPCTHIGRENCPEEHFKCMTDLTPQIVVENINKYLIKNG